MKGSKFEWDDLNEVFNKIQLLSKYLEKFPKNNRVPFNKWYVGITNSPTRRKKEHKNDYEFKNFKSWECDSAYHAAAVEEFFIKNKKTKGDQGGWNNEKNPYFIYCFYVIRKKKKN